MYILSCSEFLAPGAHDPVNVDARVAEAVRRKMHNSTDRYCFEEAEVKLSTNGIKIASLNLGMLMCCMLIDFHLY